MKRLEVHEELERSTTVYIDRGAVQRMARPSTAVSTRQISNITIAVLAAAILTPIWPAMT